MKKKIGLGSLGLVLLIIAFFWSSEINGFCLGDYILAAIKIPTWSNSANATGTHYTVWYSVIFLIPALILSIKYKENLFAKISKWLSIISIGLLVIGNFLIM